MAIQVPQSRAATSGLPMDLFGADSKDQQQINLEFIRRDSLTFKQKQATASIRIQDELENETGLVKSSPHDVNLQLLQLDRQSTLSKQSAVTAQFGGPESAAKDEDELSQDLSEEEERKAE